MSSRKKNNKSNKTDQFEFEFLRAINKLGSADGHVELFETVIPICPPACDGYNYSAGAER